MTVNPIVAQVERAIRALLGHPATCDWLRQQKLTEGLILINNSFGFRDKLKTTKSDRYLAIPVSKQAELNVSGVLVAEGRAINSDLKFVSGKAASGLAVESAEAAVKRELKALGSVVMVLIGEVRDTVILREQLNHHLFDQIVLDPASRSPLAVNGRVITIQSPADEEHLWSELENANGKALPDDLIKPFTVAVAALRRNEYALLKLPRKGAKLKDALLDGFASALENTVSEYDQSLSVSGGAAVVEVSAFNNLLRVAYNFASDAVPMVRLLVSVCDLKPIIGWCSVEQWFALGDAFRSIPWSKLKQRPSLSTYQQTISGARNRAFHHLLPVDKTLQVELGGLKKARLRLFSEYARRTEEKVDYEDKLLVDILADFTRATGKIVSPEFWFRNRRVMQATVDLLRGTSAALKLLAASR